MTALSPFRRNNGTTSATFNMEVGGKLVKAYCFDERIKAAMVPTEYNVGGVSISAKDLEDYVDKIKAKADAFDDDSFNEPLTEAESAKYDMMVKILDRRPAPFRVWVHPNQLQSGMDMSCQLTKKVHEDGSKTYKGLIKLCPLKNGDKLDKYGKVAKVPDRAKAVQSWTIECNMVTSTVVITELLIGDKK